MLRKAAPPSRKAAPLCVADQIPRARELKGVSVKSLQSIRSGFNQSMVEFKGVVHCVLHASFPCFTRSMVELGGRARLHQEPGSTRAAGQSLIK